MTTRRPLWPITSAVLAALLALSVGSWTGAIASDRATEVAAYKTVYTAAVLSRRDPDAALRKARYTTEQMVEELGMDRGKAAAEVARFLILNGGGLCQGGLGRQALR